mgnify:CR=1 FL=1
MNRGWFTLFLYTAGNDETQVTEINVELSHLHDISMCNTSAYDSHIYITQNDTNIETSVKFDAELTFTEQVHIDVGKIEDFKGDE